MSESGNKSVILVVMVIGGALLLLCCIGGAGLFFMTARRQRVMDMERMIAAKELEMAAMEEAKRAAVEAAMREEALIKERLANANTWTWRIASDGKASVVLKSKLTKSSKVTLSSVEAKVVGGTESISVKAVRQDTEQRVQFTFELGAIPKEAKAVEVVCKLTMKSGDETVTQTYKSSHSFLAASENPEALPEKDE